MKGDGEILLKKEKVTIHIILGIMYYSNKDIYEGDWLNDYRDGIGKLYFSNGDMYQGQWKNNLKDGLGCLQLYCRKIYLCKWNNH